MAMLYANAAGVFNIVADRKMGAAALVAVLAVSAAAYGHRAEPGPGARADQGWTGHLAAAASDTVEAEPMRSSSLVVPKSALTLPLPTAKPILHVKSSCDSADRLCVVRPVVVMAVPPRRQVALIDPQLELLPPAMIPTSEKTSRVAKQAQAGNEGFSLNPLKHVPDMSAIGRPFAAAGQAVSSWIK